MTRLVVREVVPYPEAWANATNEERAKAEQRFSTESRRAEWLSWRSIARELAGQDVCIVYNEYGAPTIESAPNTTYKYISVSHCRGRVAVAVSDAPCGVDIEWGYRDFSRASSRFLTPSEQTILSQMPTERIAAAVWCAKEAVYKYHSAQGHKYPDFTEDIRVVAADNGRGTLTLAAGPEEPVEVSVKWTEEGLIVATVGV